MEIKQNLTTVNRTVTNNTSRIKYIVIHFTSNNGDTAYSNTKYFKDADRGASAHYFVDENEIYQCVKDGDTAWHCGTKGTYYHALCRNANSIGIEMCSRKGSDGQYYIKEETISNTIALTKQLMQMYGVPIENILRHYDVTHKSCPEPFVRKTELWDNFKKRLTETPMRTAVDAIFTLNQKGIINTPDLWYDGTFTMDNVRDLIRKFGSDTDVGSAIWNLHLNGIIQEYQKWYDGAWTKEDVYWLIRKYCYWLENR